MKQLYTVLAIVAVSVLPGCAPVIDSDVNNPAVSFDQYRPKVTTGPDGQPMAYVPAENVEDTTANWYTNRAASTNFGYSVNYNLAAQIANPCDLAAPGDLAPPNPMAATGAIESYQRGEVAALLDQTIEVGRD